MDHVLETFFAFVSPDVVLGQVILYCSPGPFESSEGPWGLEGSAPGVGSLLDLGMFSSITGLVRLKLKDAWEANIQTDFVLSFTGFMALLLFGQLCFLELFFKITYSGLPIIWDNYSEFLKT